MERRGRKLFTRFFLLLTGGVVIAMVGSAAFFATESSLAAKRVLVIPIFMVAADLLYRFSAVTKLLGTIANIAAVVGITAVIAVTARYAAKTGVFRLFQVPKKLFLKYR